MRRSRLWTHRRADYDPAMSRALAIRSVLCLTIAAALAGCGDAGNAPATANPFQEVVDLGVARHFGVARPISSEETEPGVVTHTFDQADGPACLRGGPYRMAVRDRGSEDLFVFLQGGGTCWSDFCLAINEAPPGIPRIDILDPDRPTNPLAGTSTAYLPYCDGSLFAGDAEHDDDGDGRIDRWHRGLSNLSAALDVIHGQFPSPRRVILAGSSAGGYGTITATLLLRTKYPGVPLLVFADGGVGIAKANDPAFVGKLVDEFGVRSWLPPSCVGCLDGGHITRLVDWELERDPQLEVAVFSSYEDAAYADIFLGIGAAEFRRSLLAETGRIHAAFPDRYRRFLVDGAMHTTLLGSVTGLTGDGLGSIEIPPEALPKLAGLVIGGMDTTAIGDLTVAGWFGAMLRGDPLWADRLQ